jgi:hypothetical protein
MGMLMSRFNWAHLMLHMLFPSQPSSIELFQTQVGVIQYIVFFSYLYEQSPGRYEAGSLVVGCGLLISLYPLLSPPLPYQ